jgi:hypothetical protein
MPDLSLPAEASYLHPTPAGAYYCVSSQQSTPIRRLLQALLKDVMFPQLTLENLQAWTGTASEEHAKQILFHAQKLNWVQGFPEPQEIPGDPLEKTLPVLLKRLSLHGKVLLADPQGFYIASSGFPHEVAEELSALSADLASLHARRSGLLEDNLGMASGAWAIVDAAGNGRIGFWPVFVGPYRFVLVVNGVPKFNCPEFVRMAWVLTRRYATLPG